MRAEKIRLATRQFARRHPGGFVLYLALWIGLIGFGVRTYLDQHPCVTDPASYPWCVEPSVQVVKAHPKRIDLLAFSQDGGTLLSATRHEPGAPKLWNLSGQMRTIGEPDEVPGSLTAEPRRLNAAAFAPDGSRIFTIEDGKLMIWDGGGAELIRSLPLFESTSVDSRPARIAISPGGGTLAAARLWEVSEIAILDLGSPDAAGTIPGFTEAINDMVFREGSGTLMLAAKGSFRRRLEPVRMLDIQTGKALGVPVLPTGERVRRIGYCPSNDLLAVSWGGHSKRRGENLVVWSIGAEQQVSEILDHEFWAVSACHALAVSADNDGELTLWDLRSGTPIRDLDPGRRVRWSAIEIGPDGRTILGGTRHGALMRWRF